MLAEGGKGAARTDQCLLGPKGARELTVCRLRGIDKDVTRVS
jgi:hypothetical protein